jgi:hypothetical protein
VKALAVVSRQHYARAISSRRGSRRRRQRSSCWWRASTPRHRTRYRHGTHTRACAAPPPLSPSPSPSLPAKLARWVGRAEASQQTRAVSDTVCGRPRVHACVRASRWQELVWDHTFAPVVFPRKGNKGGCRIDFTKVSAYCVADPAVASSHSTATSHDASSSHALNS